MKFSLLPYDLKHTLFFCGNLVDFNEVRLHKATLSQFFFQMLHFLT